MAMASLVHNYACLSPSFLSNNAKLYPQCGAYAPRQPLSASSTSKFVVNCYRYCLEDVGLHKDGSSCKLEKQVKVVGLGSRRNAVLDFCSSSPLIPSSVEFWTMHSRDPGKGQSFQKFTGDVSCPIEGTMDYATEDLLGKPPLYLGSAIVLVAGSVFGSDDKEVAELLKATRSSGGLAVCIITKPFMFEGQRRNTEVEEMITKLTSLANMIIVVESDALLKREAVTLTEALKIANNAVLLAIIAISTLISDSHMKFLDVMPDHGREVSTSEILNILEHCGKAAVGFGAGYSVKASVERAAFDCPFLSGGLIQGMNNVVICIVASAKIMDEKDVEATIRAFRHIVKSNAQILCSSVLEPNLEPNVIVTTIIITGLDRHETVPKLNFWSQLSLDLPFPFSLLVGGLGLKHTNSRSSSFLREPSYSKEILSTNQRTLRKNTQRSPGDAISGTPESQQSFRTFPVCSNNDNVNDFKSQLPHTDTHFHDKITSAGKHISQDSSRLTNGSDNCGATIKGGTSSPDVALKVDGMNSFRMLPKDASDFKAKHISELHSVHEVHVKEDSDILLQGDNLNLHALTRSQEAQHKITSSNTNKTNLCASSGNYDLQREYLEGNTEADNKNTAASQGERVTHIDQASEPEIADLGDFCLKEDTTDRKKHWMPIMEGRCDIDTDNPESMVPHAEGYFPRVVWEDEGRSVCWNEGLDYSSTEALSHIRGDAQKNFEIADCIDTWRLPIGVKPIEQDKNGNNFPSRGQAGKEIQMDKVQDGSTFDADLFPWKGLAAAGLGAVMDVYHAASALVLGKNMKECRKQGLISERAASMLETERGSKKRWTPVIEMQYRGGIYRGHCQGGIPEGKGHLKYMDGSFYDGLWKHGKRSGTGVFYHSSGDIFQGSWRDDLMHGKGWFYFHNGDRWFADFWKGKANGEGRYYSKNGDVFFGHFRNNWRHGEGLYIESDGTKWCEIWDDGVLIKHTCLESEEKST